MKVTELFRAPSRLVGNLLIALALLVLASIATQPLWSTSRWAFAGDAPAHVFRAFALDRALSQGILYPRWLSDIAYGYGSPNLNFYPPLTAYVAETIHLLGTSFGDSIKVEFILAVLLAACGAFLLSEELFGKGSGARVGGLLAAVAYVDAPYFLYDVYYRGSLPEVVAMAVLPWVLWSLRRVIRRGSLGSIILAALFGAVMLLAHTLTLVLALPLLIGYALFELIRQRTHAHARGLARLVIAAGLSLGIGALYWVPFITELPLVRAGNNAGFTEETFLGHFISLIDWVQLSPAFHYGSLSLGLVIVCFGACAALLAALDKEFEGRGSVFFFTAASVISALAITEPTRVIWKLVPATAMIGFPWRMSLLVYLGLAVMIGSLPLTLPSFWDRLMSWFVTRSWHSETRDSDKHAIAAAQVQDGAADEGPRPHATGGPDTGSAPTVRRRRESRVPILLACLTVAVLAVPIIWTAKERLEPTYMDAPTGEITLGRLARFEADTGYVGLTIWDEYLPSGLKVPVGFDAPLPGGSDPAHPIAVDLVEQGPARQSIRMSSADRTAVTWRTLYYPDWRAEIDGVPAPAYASTPLGLLTVDVPSGAHIVSLSREDSVPRQAATIISGASMLLLLALGGVGLIKREQDAEGALVTLMLFLSVLLVPAAQSMGATLPKVQPVQVDVSDKLTMIGFAAEGAEFESGTVRWSGRLASLPLKLYWHVKAPLQEDTVKWRLVDVSGRVVSTPELLPRFGTGFARTWVANEIVEDYYELPLSPGLAPGTFHLEVTQGEGHAYRPVATLDLTRVTMPNASAIEQGVDARVGDGIRLLGYAASPVAAPGQSYTVTTFWEPSQTVRQDPAIFVQLWDANGNRFAQHDTVPGINVSPVLWAPGQRVAVQHALALPENVKPGLYSLIVGMYRFPDHARLAVVTQDGPSDDSVVVLGQVKVRMKPQQTSPAHPSEIYLGASIRLLGYDLAVQDTMGKLISRGSGDASPALKARSGDLLDLELRWQAAEQLENDYKVFVHLIDEQGRLVAQQDQMPGQGSYPTHIWDPGEQVHDPYEIELKLAPGRYKIMVGMYAPESGERLVAQDGNGTMLQDRQIELGVVEVSSP